MALFDILIASAASARVAKTVGAQISSTEARSVAIFSAEINKLGTISAASEPGLRRATLRQCSTAFVQKSTVRFDSVSMRASSEVVSNVAILSVSRRAVTRAWMKITRLVSDTWYVASDCSTCGA